MEQINKNIRNCGTCAYWLGFRRPNRLGYVEVKNRMDSGKCGAMGLIENRKYQAVYSCSKYVEWIVVK